MSAIKIIAIALVWMALGGLIYDDFESQRARCGGEDVPFAFVLVIWPIVVPFSVFDEIVNPRKDARR